MKSAAEYVAIEKLIPWVKNPRRNDAAVREVAKSIERFGFAAPVVARRESNEVIAGHTRIKAAILLKMTEVPVRYLDIDEREAHLLALADNKLGEISDWDDAALQEILSDFSLEEVQFAGWTMKELGEMADEIIEKPKKEKTATLSVVVTCISEDQQTELLERLEAEGFRCKAQ